MSNQIYNIDILNIGSNDRSAHHVFDHKTMEDYTLV